MKSEIFMKLTMSFKAMGFSMQQVANAIKLLAKQSEYSRELIKKLEHRRKCVLIAYAMSQTCSQKKKFILWNMFKNVEFK